MNRNNDNFYRNYTFKRREDLHFSSGILYAFIFLSPQKAFFHSYFTIFLWWPIIFPFIVNHYSARFTFFFWYSIYIHTFVATQSIFPLLVYHFSRATDHFPVYCKPLFCLILIFPLTFYIYLYSFATQSIFPLLLYENSILSDHFSACY